eukprot:GHVN01026884.1.p2 GENE.GHVN01026884.1~~GHVN01026884.1.p2  ORF type:complete len:268 (-),score=53.56 GHVN01026884.1:1725-2528(-)
MRFQRDRDALKMEFPDLPLSTSSEETSEGCSEGCSDERDDESDYADEEAWIDWFCGLKGHEFFVAVEDEYIRDDFNLTGLRECIPFYDSALDIILDNDEEDTQDLDEDQQREVQRTAQVLYGLVHARFILTARGLNLMLDKFKRGTFGKCPNAYCANQLMLPIGLTDYVDQNRVKLFCPRCNEIYHPKSGRSKLIDGAYFGSTFPHLFCMLNEGLLADQGTISAVPSATVLIPRPIPDPKVDVYVPTVYGFRVHRNVKDRLREGKVG